MRNKKNRRRKLWTRSNSSKQIQTRKRRAFESLESRALLTGTPTLIDLNSVGASAPSDFAPVGNITYFVANDGVNGGELWKTDGTPQGTSLVRDIRPGSESSTPQQLVEFSDELFFVADDGITGPDLWKSDGTSAGTVMVRDFNASPTDLVVVNERLFISIEDSVTGGELWATDGTQAGTVLVRGIASGANTGSYETTPTSPNIKDLINVNGTLFFTADDGINGRELWKSDGTSNGTVMVRDIVTGTYPYYSNGTYYGQRPSSGNPQKLTAAGAFLFFVARDANGLELWRSDGTTAGTFLLRDINAGSADAFTDKSALVALGNQVLFTANDGVSGEELWGSDGTTSGTMQLKDINPGSAGDLSKYVGFTESNGTLFFSANDGVLGRELWKTDGTISGTALVKDINSGTDSYYGTPNNSYPFYMASVNGTLYFSAHFTSTGRELWQSDGTAAGTVLVADVIPGTDGFYPNKLTRAGNTLVFSGDNGDGRELWTLAPESEATTNSARVTIYVNGQQVAIPANIGVNSDGSKATVYTENSNGDVFSQGGSIVTLGDFFDTWRTNSGLAGNNANAFLSATQLLSNIEDTSHTVQMFVNGQVSSGFGDYVLRNNDQIVLVFGDNPVVSLNTTFGAIVIELFEHDTPGTVDNFLNYINGGDYINSFFHRSDTGFVIQGGGFTTTSTVFASTTQFSAIATDPPIANEPGISNVRGTVAMAKTSDPNSATSQFFVNLDDTNTFLDDPSNSGGFTVFGQVLDMTTSDTIASLPINTSNASPYGELPVSSSNQLAVIQSIAGQGEISGVQFSDDNRNGVLDSGEAAIAGTSIYIDANNNGLLDSGELVTTTDANGQYRFQLQPGTYTVRAELGAGRIATVPVSPDSYSVTVEIGREVADRNFGETTLQAPTGIALAAVSDVGVASNDNLTNLNNNSDATRLQFEVTGVTPGAEVRIYSDGNLIAITAATTSTVTVVTTGQTTLLDGTYSITATQSIAGGESDPSLALAVTIDTMPPHSLLSIAPPFAQIGETYLFDADSPDEGQAGFDYSIDNTPAGMSIDAASGLVSWTPTIEQAVPQTFGIRMSDAAGNATTQTVNLTVLGVIPAYPDTYSVDEDTTLTVDATVGVLSNDGTGATSTLSATIVGQTAHGFVALNSDGSFTYTPVANSFGQDTFTYVASDGTDDTNVAQVTITVAPVNDPVIVAEDSYTTAEDTVLNVDAFSGVLANDANVDGDTLTVVIAAQPTNGAVTLNTNGSFTFVPDANFSGSDSFTYVVNDGTVNSDPVIVHLTITEVPDAPNAVADSYTVDEGLTLSVVASSGVLTNDFDPDSAILTAQISSQPTHGTVSFGSDGSFVYTPSAGFVGTDSFVYIASDGVNQSSPAIVSITVNNLPDPPTATISGFVYLDVDQNGVRNASEIGVPGVQITLSGSDFSGMPIIRTVLTTDAGSYSFDALSAGTYQIIERQPIVLSQGSDSTTVLSAVANNDSISNISLSGGQTFTENNFGETSLLPQYISIVWFFASSISSNALFRETIAMGEERAGNTSLASSIRAGTVDAPTNDSNSAVAMDDTYSVDANGTLSTSATNGVLANDVDESGGLLTAQLVASATNGVITLNIDGSFTYSPNAGFSGSDSFAYQASNGDLTSNISTVTITVLATNTAPLVNSDAYSAVSGVSLVVDAAGGVLANDSDADGDLLTAELIGTPSNGSANLNADGAFSYTPDAGFTGTDSFAYWANDGVATSEIAVVTITVSAAGTAPVANGDSFSIAEDGILTSEPGGVLANDTSDGNAGLTAVQVTTPANGALVLNADGSFEYIPNNSFHGTDTFIYEASDGTFVSQLATVTITVESVNDIPTAADDSYHVAPGEPLTVNALSGVLSNDSDADGDPLTATIVNLTSNGSLALSGDGSFNYTPNSGFSGIDSFTYTASDGIGNSAIRTATIEVADLDLMELRLETTSLDGAPVNSIAQGDAFILNVYAADLRSVPEGVFSAYLDLLYDPSKVALNGSLTFSDMLSNGQSGDTTTAGLIDELGAFSGVITPPGVAESLLVSIPFKANAVGTALFTSDPADLLPAHDAGLFGLDDPIAVDHITYNDTMLEITSQIAGEGESTSPGAFAAQADQLFAAVDDWLSP